MLPFPTSDSSLIVHSLILVKESEYSILFSNHASALIYENNLYNKKLLREILAFASEAR